mgnify:CR=1 FL=1
MKYIRQLSPTRRLFVVLLAILALAAALYSGILQQRVVNPALAPLLQALPPEAEILLISII